MDAADVDAFRFVVAVQAGHRALTVGGLRAAVRGPGVVARPGVRRFGGCPALEAEAARLEQLRLDAVEWRIQAELASADTAPPVAELEALVRKHPTREGLWALLMRALYRAGRQADAHEAYRRARRALVEERLRDIAAVPTPLRLQIAATVDGLIDEIHDRPAAAAERLHAAASGWEALDYWVEAAFARVDLARNMRAAGDPDAAIAAEHADSVCRNLGVIPLDQYLGLADRTT